MKNKILLCGSKGRMGQAITNIAADHNCEITVPIDQGDDPESGISIVMSLLIFRWRMLPKRLLELRHQLVNQWSSGLPVMINQPNKKL